MQAVEEKKTQLGGGEGERKSLGKGKNMFDMPLQGTLSECFLKHINQVEHLGVVVCAYIPIWTYALSSRPPWTI